MNKQTLSVVISAFNEEKKIEECLKSIQDLASEVIVVDNSSTDKTTQIVKKYTSKIFKRENNLMLNINKNYGFSKATSDWILSLDADERVTEELSDEIRALLQSEVSEIDGYYMPRKNIIFGKWISHTGWYPDHQLRLFRKGKGKFPEKNVHEMLVVEGRVEYLKHPILHYNYETVSQFLRKHTIIYAPNEAEDRLRKGYNFHYFDSVRFPAKEFMSRFFAREGYKDGVHGLVLSILLAFYHFIIFCYLWEKFNFEDKTNGSFLKDTEKEFNKVGKEMKYWFLTSLYKNTNDTVEKLFIKLKRRL